MSESLEDERAHLVLGTDPSIIEIVQYRPVTYVGSTDYHGLHWML